jgi:hypothetical protein
MYADLQNATIGGKPATEAVPDHAWLKEEFLPQVGKRGAEITASGVFEVVREGFEHDEFARAKLAATTPNSWKIATP